ncbi:quinone oxidoreductase family protein [Nocardia jinanensis]|uniref:Oxidoreductase n=1 Tax=Nocardia jinanensis TaxID=382504 RepID=A0A917R759_9NOCA|nr:zinc-binding dehydrogenase [Nocardia jinanensis]GGK93806.1 oxidoreductase [Nocardia jinanensis]
MQAIVMTGIGGPEVLVPRETPEPRPGPGEVLIRAEAIPVLYPETQLRSGAFPMTSPPPVVFGFQAAGEVIAVGEGVGTEYLGRRVVADTAGAGSYAESVCVRAESTTPIPAGVSTTDAAAVMMSGSVALALLETAALTGTETVLIEAGATGVGSYLVQLAREFGAARVIATAGSPDKARRAKELGADEVVDHRPEQWAGDLNSSADGAIDIVFDSFGGTSATTLLDTMTPGSGRMLSYGWLSGEPARVSAAELIPRGLTLTGCSGPAWHGRVGRARTAILERVPRLAPPVEAILPLDRAAEAHERVESRVPLGKIILRPDHAQP